MNPEYLLCDTDALLQTLMSKQVGLLVHLRQRYKVIAAVVPEVESEICNHSKFGKRFEADFLRLVSTSNAVVLDTAAVRTLLTARGRTPGQIEQTLRLLREVGPKYNLIVGRGEAYSHAMGGALGLPLMSHDWEAVRALDARGEPLAVPVAGFFDLVALGVEERVLVAEDCERIVRTLTKMGEWVPSPLRSSGGVIAALGRFRRLRPWSQGGDPPRPAGPRDTQYLRT